MEISIIRKGHPIQTYHSKIFPSVGDKLELGYAENYEVVTVIERRLSIYPDNPLIIKVE